MRTFRVLIYTCVPSLVAEFLKGLEDFMDKGANTQIYNIVVFYMMPNIIIFQAFSHKLKCRQVKG